MLSDLSPTFTSEPLLSEQPQDGYTPPRTTLSFP
jgi:hypothetical protein